MHNVRESVILGFSEVETSDLDLDYFRQLIESKTEGNHQSYIETLAMKQMSGDVDAEGKISIYLWIGCIDLVGGKCGKYMCLNNVLFQLCFR